MATGVALIVPDAITVRRALVQSSLAPIDAQALLAHVLGCDRAWLLAHPTEALGNAAAGQFFALAARRRNGEPIAYLTGRREFWSLDLDVDPGVLIPRPETETLVECALRLLPNDRELRILDLGTGSGAVALALAHERPRARVIGTDFSEAALAVARRNAERLDVRNVEWAIADWFDGFDVSERFDAIVSNPPYVAASDPHLREGDVRHEPVSALVSGADGLGALRLIVSGACAHLVEGGAIVVEHGYDQAPAVRGLLEQSGFTAIASFRDLAGVPRVAVARRP